MRNDDDGGNAFPTELQFSGMTLRDYFAGQALVAYVLSADRSHSDGERDDGPTLEEYAEQSYRIAAAMIDEKRRLEARQ